MYIDNLLDVLNKVKPTAVLWDQGEASVREITDVLSQDHDLAYTTILTTTRIMADKGYVGFRKDGRTHIYTPLVTRNTERTSAVSNILRNLFDGSPRALAQHLIEGDELSPEDIQALRDLLDGDPS